MTTGEKIAALRKGQGLSQEALGEKLGLSRQAVSKWEADQAVPTMDNLVELGRLFGVPVDTLLRPDATLPERQAAEGVKISAEGLKISYAPVLTRKTKWFVWAISALFAAAVLVSVLGLIANKELEEEVARLQTQVQQLRLQVEDLQQKQEIVVPSEKDVTEAQGDLVEWDLSYMLDQNDPEQMVITMSALPREVNEQEIPKFVIRSGAENWSCETWLDGTYSGQKTIPICDHFSAYLVLTAPDGTVRNFLIGTETGVKEQLSLLATAVWREGGISTVWGMTSVSGSIEIVVDLHGREVWPVSGRIVLLQDGKQVAEQPVTALADNPIAPDMDDATYEAAVNWQGYDLEAGELTVELELTDNFDRVQTYPIY